MKPADLQPGQLEAWLANAPKELLLIILERLLKVDSAHFRQVVEDAWEVFLQSPDRRQHREIREAVADALRRRFHFADAVANRLAVELVGPTSEPANQAVRNEIALPAAEWQRVREAVLSVDVLYQTPETGPHTAWGRQTRVFLRDEGGAVRSINQEVKLRWDDLPSDVRQACVKQAQVRQRFVLFDGGATPA